MDKLTEWGDQLVETHKRRYGYKMKQIKVHITGSEAIFNRDIYATFACGLDVSCCERNAISYISCYDALHPELTSKKVETADVVINLFPNIDDLRLDDELKLAEKLGKETVEYDENMGIDTLYDDAIAAVSRAFKRKNDGKSWWAFVSREEEK